ncbi:uncharacterized protein EDB91DRAFT_1061683, partial [Suillus paluster]|uniref:uncharacterized protein n=1 Tax=Suillus paluster TaxID=48578 RepID=UPI001B87B179
PLIIDNGSSNLHFEFASPHSSPNVIAKYKERRFAVTFGNAIDAESSAKSQVKTPQEGDVLLNFNAIVHFLNCCLPH